jgi:hypothetical protein
VTARIVLGVALIVLGVGVVVFTLRLARRMGPSHRAIGLGRVALTWICVVGGCLMTLSGCGLLVQPI